jgi:hypothetical protein
MILVLAIALSCRSATGAAPWPTVTLANAKQVSLSGPLGAAFDRGIARLSKPPYTEPWLRSDVSFEVPRDFNNYSGDVSGRCLELAALAAPRLSTLKGLLATIPNFQKPDGHFGVDVDLSKPLVRSSPPIPMLWGNARLLVGLVTCSEELRDPKALETARKLGDFYVTSVEQLCSPAREAEYRASGSDPASYTCCYFPVIESLARLYQATKDDRYLKTAQRIADFFMTKFDALPIDHSHANLCAWRGILLLYVITGNRDYLDRAKAKWDAAMTGGYVWPIGGVGEHWNVNYHIDEGCSESDWLRFNVDLWRFTGEVRYLDAAERLLWNQYLVDQSDNGGYGHREFAGDAAGPIATTGPILEAYWCCGFHGPLGLHFLKSHLATGSDDGVFVNFPLDFTAPVKAGGRDWQVRVATNDDSHTGQAGVELELAAKDANGDSKTTLWLRIPNWVSGVKEVRMAGQIITPTVERGYLRIDAPFHAGKKVQVLWQSGLAIEGRRFHRLQPEPGKVVCHRNVSILSGPQVLFASFTSVSGRPVLLATVDKAGAIGLLGRDASGFATVQLPSADVGIEQIASVLDSAKLISLRPWQNASRNRPAIFAADVVVVPADAIPADALSRFSDRMQNTPTKVEQASGK